ncbi:MAG: VWA domain-containing protein [Anaerolineae bacterium]|nr:VWA domain-containing protein [Anaerolineae bacterium]
MVKNYLLQMKDRFKERLQPQKGQSIIIVTFAFLGLLAMLGLALDLGLVYIERVRVSRTTDAAALAAVVELPFEEEAMRRAIEFIELNGYNTGPGGDTEIRVRGCVDVSGDLANVDSSGKLGDNDAMQPSPSNLIDGYLYQAAGVNPPRAVFVIDTLAYQPFDTDDDGDITTKNGDNCIDDSLYGTANKIRVAGQVNVDMNFMQFFGFGEVPVSDRAVGENVTNLDVVVVFDVSGSMDFETTCFDCWEPAPKNDPKFDVIANPWPNNGYSNPLPDIATNNICTQAPQPIVHSTGKYFVHEAEHYSRDVPWQGWRFERRVAGQGFWVIQRTDRNASGTDARGSYIRAHPFPVYSQSSINNYPQLQGAAYNNECFSSDPSTNFMSGTCWSSKANILDEPVPPSTPPYVEYDFIPDWSGNTHVWIRAQGSGNYGWEWNGSSPGDNPSGYRNLPEWRKAIFWQVGKADGSDWELVNGRNYTNLEESGDQRHPDSDEWRWLKLGSVPTTSGTQHTLRLYQGSAGFQVDKILFTNFAGGDQNTTIEETGSGSVRGDGSGITTAFKNFLKQDGWHGPAATPGSGTREACNVCNPVFGDEVTPAQCSCKVSSSDSAASDYGAGGAGLGCTQVLTPTDSLENDLFHDEDPIRSAKEAVKNFANRLDPKFDQIGFVAYSNDVYNSKKSGIDQRAELQCIKWATKNATGVRECYETTNPISYTKLIRTVEIHENTYGTNIPLGMREGLEELGVETANNTDIDPNCDPGINDKSVCDRQGAARRILVLMTDGSPNDDDKEDAEGCPSEADDMWEGNFGQGKGAYDCSIYYAQQAAHKNVTVYTIGIGSGVNFDLLTAMATGVDPNDPNPDHKYFESRGGQYFPAAKPSDLDLIFDTILSNIFVRIVG